MIGRVERCRSCGAGNLRTVLDLGRTPLANRLLRADQLAEPEPTFPLEVAFCPDCSLVQILDTVPPEELFRDYCYFSSFSDTMIRHAHELTKQLIESRRLGRDSLVVEAASNDGYLLRNYKEAGIGVLGIEPAENIARVANDAGIETVAEFFTKEFAVKLCQDGKRADVFHAHNVLAHVPDLNGFVAGIRAILKEDGVAVVEAPYVGNLVEHCEFDTIYHEHLCYFSLTALNHCFSRHGLLIEDVEVVPIHGGSLRIYAVPEQVGREAGPRVGELLAREYRQGMTRWEYYSHFADRVSILSHELRTKLVAQKEAGKTIAAYGASAKGSTLLNFCGIGADLLDFVVDRSSVKQGLYTPGTHLEIRHPEELEKQQPDYVLLLTWNFADEILEQQANYRAAGGRFIVPVPEVRVA